MKLYGGSPYWLLGDRQDHSHDPLPSAVDVVVIGAGITGALIAEMLVLAGFSVAVIDRRPLASGSTAASTALLLYQLDAELGQLTAIVGQAVAGRVYARVYHAIDRLETISHSLPDDCGFHRRDSLYLASRQSHVRRLRGETARLQQHGFDAAWLSAESLRQAHGLAAHGAIHTRHAAEVDPVRLALALLRNARNGGATVTDETSIVSLDARADGITVTTDRGTIAARWCISAMGYETPPGITPPVVTLHSSFAFATTPLADPGPLARGTMLWESARPYFYARTTEDGRLMVGGADLPFSDTERRDALLPARLAMLEQTARGWLPALEFEIATGWCGTFAESADGIPCIGPLPGMPRVFLALCAGGNGIPFAMIAAEMAAAWCLGVADPDVEVFALDRPTIRGTIPPA